MKPYHWPRLNKSAYSYKDQPIGPHMYKTGDGPWIMRQMAKIPRDQAMAVSDQYMRIFMDGQPDSRRRANEYLRDEARKYT